MRQCVSHGACVFYAVHMVYCATPQHLHSEVEQRADDHDQCVLQRGSVGGDACAGEAPGLGERFVNGPALWV